MMDMKMMMDNGYEDGGDDDENAGPDLAWRQVDQTIEGMGSGALEPLVGGPTRRRNQNTVLYDLNMIWFLLIVPDLRFLVCQCKSKGHVRQLGLISKMFSRVL